MAEKRRLQGEIDRTLKKVNEGRMSFKETLDKFESSTNHAQKEKHEADLKKEIKKLQRFRDNIKTWLASPDVKDKTQLTDMRKLIESDMERFKVIEKETKTKAYSKEGLYTETKKDPMQKEKEDHLEWLKIQISKLSKNIEVCDFDILKLNPVKKKRNAEKDKLNDLSQKLGMFKNHLTKQETLMRLLDNDKIELDKVKDFRYTFEDFINNPDQELYKSDQGLFIYDELNLDELSADISIAADLDLSGKLDGLSVELLTTNCLPHFVEKKDIINDKIELPLETIQLDDSVAEKVSQLKISDKPKEKPQPKFVKPKHNSESVTNDNGKLKPQAITVTSTPIKNCSVPLDGSDYLSIHNISDSSIKETPIEVPVSNLVSCHQVNTANTPIMETVSTIDTPPLIKENYIISDVIKSTVSVPETFSVVSTAASYVTTFSATHEAVVKSAPIKPPKLETPLPPPPPPPPPPSLPQSQQLQSQPQPSQHLLENPPINNQQYFEISNYMPMMQPNDMSINPYVVHRSSIPNLLEHSSISTLLPGPNNNSTMNNKDNTIDMILEPGDAMSPFRNHSFQNIDYYNNQVTAMEHGRLKQPLTSDSEKARLIIYKNETQIPDYFPKDPIPSSDTEDYYMRLDSDTLFFIFYYFEGTKAQYLAAKALKRMSWRFHTGHMCWFQRHEEPKQITDNSESGTYIFYDYESMSRQKKENFTFSYNYLEDKDF